MHISTPKYPHKEWQSSRFSTIPRGSDVIQRCVAEPDQIVMRHSALAQWKSGPPFLTLTFMVYFAALCLIVCDTQYIQHFRVVIMHIAGHAQLFHVNWGIYSNHRLVSTLSHGSYASSNLPKCWQAFGTECLYQLFPIYARLGLLLMTTTPVDVM